MTRVNRFSKSVVDLLLELLPLIWEQRAKEKEETFILGKCLPQDCLYSCSSQITTVQSKSSSLLGGFSFLGRWW